MRRWAGYATTKLPIELLRTNPGTYFQFVERFGERSEEWSYKGFLSTSDREEVDRLLRHLHGAEAEVVRLYHLEGKSYEEISSRVGMPANSIGPTLSRARAKIRQVGVDTRSPG